MDTRAVLLKFGAIQNCIFFSRKKLNVMPYVRRSYTKRRYSRKPGYRRSTSSYKGRSTGSRSRPRKGKYAKAYGKRSVISRPNSFLSLDSYFAKLRFQDCLSFSLPQVTFTDYVQYSLNSVYDPYYGVGGGIIKGHAEMSSIWQKYMVMGALFKLKGAFWSEDPNDMINSSRPYIAFFQAVDSANSGLPDTPDVDRLAEQGSECKYHTVVPAFGTQQRVCLLKKYFSVKRVEGCPISGNIEEYSSFTSNDPVLQPSVLVGITQVDQTGFWNIKFSGTLTIKYYVRYFNRTDTLA